jgi:hypothetical protein
MKRKPRPEMKLEYKKASEDCGKDRLKLGTETSK